jgi:hypothetical protein
LRSACTAHLRRQIIGIHDVLDADRAAIDARQRRACAITRGRGIGGGACAFSIQHHERFHFALAHGNAIETALE